MLPKRAQWCKPQRSLARRHPMSLKASGGTGSAAGATATEPDPPQRTVAHDKGPEDPFAAKKLCRSVECRRPALFAVVHLLLPMNTSFWARQRPEKPGNPYSPFQTLSPKYTSSRLVAQVYIHEASRASIVPQGLSSTYNSARLVKHANLRKAY